MGAVVSTPLVTTKILLPRLRSDLLRRPRLIDFLHSHVNRKLILISASAGYGKTSLLISFAHETELPVCWYSLDPSDNDPRLFLEYLVASIRQRFPDFGQRTLVLLRESARNELEPAVNMLINEIQTRIQGDVVIILDDYQEVEENAQVNAIVDRLLRHLPDTCHIILSTRTLPRRLSLTTLTARRQAAGLGANDLRFTPAEIQALAEQNYQLTLTEEQAAAWAERSEGWITGILLTTHAMWQGLLQSLMRIQGSGSQVFEYLANEVFQQQPEEIQHFLLASSVFREMTPAMCDALLEINNSLAVLQTLELRNLFINRLEGPEAWFRYHQLFREFLEQKLRTEFPDEYRRLHRRAGELAQDMGRWDAAVYHYHEAELPERIAALIEQVAADVYDRGRWRTLTRWMDLLPQEIQDRHPMLKFWRAKIYVEMADLDEALRLLHEACEGFRAVGDLKRLARALVEHASVLRLMGDHMGAIADCEAVLEMGERAETSTIALAHRVIGTCYGLRGEFTVGARELEEALRLYRQIRDRDNEAYLYHDLGTMYELIGDIDRSSAYFRQALRYWEATDKPWALANTLNSIGNSHYYRGEYEEAQKALERALDKAREAGYTRIEAYILASLGDLYRDTGRLSEAVRAYRDGLEIAQQVNEAMITVYIMAALGNAYRQQRQWSQAQGILQQALLLAEHHDSGYEIGLCKLSLGMLVCDMGDHTKAQQYLEQAYALFESGGAQREQARAALQLAHLEFVRLHRPQAIQFLLIALDIAENIGCDQFMLTDGTRLLPLYRYALRRRVGVSRLRKICNRIREMQRAQEPASVTVRPMPQTVRIQAFALGPSRVMKDGRLLTRADWGSTVTREMFFYLLEHRQPLRKEQIIDIFWAEVNEEKANSNFHSTAYRLRRAIAQDTLLYENGLYRLNPDLEIWYDVDAFQELIAQVAREDLSMEQREELLERAIDLYQGDFLAEFYSDWCVPQREALKGLYLEAVLQLGGIRVLQDDPEGAMEMFETALGVDSYREETYMLLMQMCALKGDLDGVRYWYRRCEDVLMQELGMPPSEATTRFYRELLG
ncbi:MAG: tetratricopeptide repeat protein [Chloroflexi bacterium]|nr:tetratricopeptide repeat protein [Chloroflexota bacterium]